MNFGLICQSLVRCQHQFHGHGGVDQIPVFKRWTLSQIQAVVELSAGLDIDHQGGTSLEHAHTRTMAMQILCDVMGTRARAHDQDWAITPL